MSSLFDRIGQNVQKALETKLGEMRDEVQKRISVDVERRGGKVIRSRPGEPPRRDTKKLYKSAESEVIHTDDTVTGAVSVETPYAQRLNDPAQLDRPIFGDILRNNVESIRDVARNGILTTPSE